MLCVDLAGVRVPSREWICTYILLLRLPWLVSDPSGGWSWKANTLPLLSPWSLWITAIIASFMTGSDACPAPIFTSHPFGGWTRILCGQGLADASRGGGGPLCSQCVGAPAWLASNSLVPILPEGVFGLGWC